MQIKTRRRCHCTATRVLKIEHPCWQGLGATWGSHARWRGSVHWYHQFGRLFSGISKALWLSISALYQTPAGYHLRSFSLTLLWRPWLLFLPFQGQLAGISHHPHPQLDLLCSPWRHEMMRCETGIHRSITKNARELTHLGLSFDNDRWELVDRCSLIPQPAWTVLPLARGSHWPSNQMLLVQGCGQFRNSSS